MPDYQPYRPQGVDRERQRRLQANAEQRELPDGEFVERKHRNACHDDRAMMDKSPARRSAHGGKKPPMGRWRLAAIAACTVVLLFSATALIRYAADYQHSQDVSAEMRELYHAAEEETTAPEPTEEIRAAAAQETDAPTDSPEVNMPVTLRATVQPYDGTGNTSDKFAALQRRNSRILGWLTVEGVVDEPVAQWDNTYYLTHDYLGNRSSTGSLFLDQNCDLTSAPENMVIHGHNMKTGAMFGSLKKYKVKGAPFLQEAGLVQFDTIYEEATYAVFAVAVINVKQDQFNYLNFMGNMSFPSDEAFNRYIERIRVLSSVSVPMDVAPTDRLLTLATCAGDDENERLLVFCRKLREGETKLDMNYIFAHSTNR